MNFHKNLLTERKGEENGLFRFMDSKDIREHLRQIGYSFTAPEAAFLVWQCRSATLKEKISAWREISEAMPNCPLTRRKEEPIGNCHDFFAAAYCVSGNDVKDVSKWKRLCLSV